MIRELAACALLLSGTANAGTLGLHLGSQHFPAKNYNNVNPGVYYIHDTGWTAGAYYNSRRRASAYAGYTLERGPWRLQLGVVSGYRRGIMPGIIPSVALGNGFRLTVIPGIKAVGSTVVHLSWEIKL